MENEYSSLSEAISAVAEILRLPVEAVRWYVANILGTADNDCDTTVYSMPGGSVVLATDLGEVTWTPAPRA